jgi:hypothetical protein
MLFLKLIKLYSWYIALLEILQCHDCLLQNSVAFQHSNGCNEKEPFVLNLLHINFFFSFCKVYICHILAYIFAVRT